MSNADVAVSQLLMVATAGQYFTDASKRFVQSEVSLWCDWCHTEPLHACIRACGMDLCLPCAGTLLKLNDLR